MSAEQLWNMGSAIIGGVIGALAGGIPAWLLARKASKETLERDREQRVAREKALAFSVSVKLVVIVNSVLSLRGHVKGCLSLLDTPEHKHMVPWQVLIPMVGHTDEGDTRFTAEEMAIFMAADEMEYLRDIMLLAQRHAAAIASFREYRVARDGLRPMLPAPEGFDGQMGTMLLSQQQVNALAPYTIPLDNVARDLAESLEEDLELARRVANDFGPILKRYFNEPKMPALSFPTDEKLAAMAAPPNPKQAQ